jgi:hypothetical protein
MVTEKSKQIKPNELWKTVGFPEITHATKLGLWSAGKKDDDNKLFSEALETIPTRALKIRKAWAVHLKNVLVPYTPVKALSSLCEAHLTKS